MLIILLIGSYLLGSIPFAYLFSKWFRGIDIRTVGSRNPGAANVISQAGKGVGALVVVCDFAKGLLPVLAAKLLGLPLWTVGMSGILAVVGHCWPIYMRFDGGEGMMTGMGVIVGLTPIEFAFSLLAATIAGSLSKHLELKGWFNSKTNFGSVIGFIFLFFWLIHWRRPLELIAIIGIMTAVLIVRQLQVAKTHFQDF